MFEEELYIAHLSLFLFCELVVTDSLVDWTGLGTGIKEETILETCLAVEEERLK